NVTPHESVPFWDRVETEKISTEGRFWRIGGLICPKTPPENRLRRKFYGMVVRYRPTKTGQSRSQIQPLGGQTRPAPRPQKEHLQNGTNHVHCLARWIGAGLSVP